MSQHYLQINIASSETLQCKLSVSVQLVHYWVGRHYISVNVHFSVKKAVYLYVCVCMGGGGNMFFWQQKKSWTLLFCGPYFGRRSYVSLLKKNSPMQMAGQVRASEIEMRERKSHSHFTPFTIWLYIFSWSVCTLADLICVHHWLVFYFHFRFRENNTFRNSFTTSKIQYWVLAKNSSIHLLEVCGSKKANKSKHTASKRQGQSKTLFLEGCWSCCLQGLMGFLKVAARWLN